MEIKIYICLLGILAAIPVEMNGAEKRTALLQKTIILESNNGLRFAIKREIAELSLVVKAWVEESPETKLIPLPLVTGHMLEKLVPLMEFAYKVMEAPLRTQIDQLSNKISREFANPSLKVWIMLLNGINYLNIEILKRPFADSMIKYIYDQAKGSRDLIADRISNLSIPDEFKGLLAKYWYLNYGKNRIYILEDDLDYGFSIEELRAFDKLKLYYRIGSMLDLSAMLLNDLTGLENMPDKESVSELILSANCLETVPKNSLEGFKQLRFLNISRNRMIMLPEKVLSGLDKLAHIYLEYNKLNALPENIFKGLVKLKSIDLTHNNISQLPVNIIDGLPQLEYIKLYENPLSAENKKALKDRYGKIVAAD